MVNMNKFRYLRIFTLGLHSYINRTFHPVYCGMLQVTACVLKVFHAIIQQIRRLVLAFTGRCCYKCQYLMSQLFSIHRTARYSNDQERIWRGLCVQGNSVDVSLGGAG